MQLPLETCERMLAVSPAPCTCRGLPGQSLSTLPVGSYPTVAPLPVPLRAIGGHHFCGTILTVARTGRYPATCSVVPGLSSGVTSTPAIVCPSLFNRHHSRFKTDCTEARI